MPQDYTLSGSGYHTTTTAGTGEKKRSCSSTTSGISSDGDTTGCRVIAHPGGGGGHQWHSLSSPRCHGHGRVGVGGGRGDFMAAPDQGLHTGYDNRAQKRSHRQSAMNHRTLPPIPYHAPPEVSPHTLSHMRTHLCTEQRAPVTSGHLVHVTPNNDNQLQGEGGAQENYYYEYGYPILPQPTSILEPLPDTPSSRRDPNRGSHSTRRKKRRSRTDRDSRRHSAERFATTQPRQAAQYGSMDRSTGGSREWEAEERRGSSGWEDVARRNNSVNEYRESHA